MTRTHLSPGPLPPPTGSREQLCGNLQGCRHGKGSLTSCRMAAEWAHAESGSVGWVGVCHVVPRALSVFSSLAFRFCRCHVRGREEAVALMPHTYVCLYRSCSHTITAMQARRCPLLRYVLHWSDIVPFRFLRCLRCSPTHHSAEGCEMAWRGRAMAIARDTQLLFGGAL